MRPSRGAEARAVVHDTKALFITASYFPCRWFVHVFRTGRAAGSWERAMTQLAAYHTDMERLSVCSHLGVTVCICTVL